MRWIESAYKESIFKYACVIVSSLTSLSLKVLFGILFIKDAIIIEEYLGQKISDIIEHDVDVLVIGDDWRSYSDANRYYYANPS